MPIGTGLSGKDVFDQIMAWAAQVGDDGLRANLETQLIWIEHAAQDEPSGALATEIALVLQFYFNVVKFVTEVQLFNTKGDINVVDPMKGARVQAGFVVFVERIAQFIVDEQAKNPTAFTLPMTPKMLTDFRGAFCVGMPEGSDIEDVPSQSESYHQGIQYLIQQSENAWRYNAVFQDRAVRAQESGVRYRMPVAPWQDDIIYSLARVRDEARHIWVVRITCNGDHVQAARFGNVVAAFGVAFESVPGVICDVQNFGHGSKWADLKLSILNMWRRDETQEIVAKTRQAVEAHYADKPIQEVRKLSIESEKINAERALLERQREQLLTGVEADTARSLEIEAMMLQNLDKALDIQMKQVQLQQLKMNMVERASDLMKRGIIAADPVSIDINGYPFLSVDNGRFIQGSAMSDIAEAETLPPAPDAGEPPSTNDQ